MKRIHLLAVADGAERFEPLVAAARAAGYRVGWLDLERPAEVPGELAPALAAGLARAVAAGAGRVVAAKPLVGPPVLRDLLREHFLGCRLVLVRGAAPAPRLAPGAGGWRVEGLAAGARELSTAELVKALARPGFLGPAAGEA